MAAEMVYHHYSIKLQNFFHKITPYNIHSKFNEARLKNTHLPLLDFFKTLPKLSFLSPKMFPKLYRTTLVKKPRRTNGLMMVDYPLHGGRPWKTWRKLGFGNGESLRKKMAV